MNRKEELKKYIKILKSNIVDYVKMELYELIENTRESIALFEDELAQLEDEDNV